MSMWTTARVTGHGRSSTDTSRRRCTICHKAPSLLSKSGAQRQRAGQQKEDTLRRASYVLRRRTCLIALAADLMRTPAALERAAHGRCAPPAGSCQQVDREERARCVRSICRASIAAKILA